MFTTTVPVRRSRSKSMPKVIASIFAERRPTRWTVLAWRSSSRPRSEIRCPRRPSVSTSPSRAISARSVRTVRSETSVPRRASSSARSALETGPAWPRSASSSWNMEYTDKAISLAKNLWKAGGIPAFTWHWKDPLDKKDAFYIQSAANGGEYTDFDFSTGFKPGTTEWNTESAAYKGIVADIDHIADYFLELQKEGVAGIFRPLHEAGGKWFWWSINSGEQFAALYRLVFDRMVKVKGVKNMIWVFNPEGSTVTSWNPGSEYYDVLSIDIYNSANDHSSNASAFDKFKNASNATKILALSENGPIPDVNNMHTDEAVWSWWMPWYSTWSGTWPGQTKDAVWKSNMDDERVLSLEDMPGWGNYTANTNPDTTVTPPDSGTIRLVKAPQFYGTATTVGIFDMNGHYVGKSLSVLPQGRYIVRQRVQGGTKSTLYIKK